MKFRFVPGATGGPRRASIQEEEQGKLRHSKWQQGLSMGATASIGNWDRLWRKMEFGFAATEYKGSGGGRHSRTDAQEASGSMGTVGNRVIDGIT